MPTIHVTVNQLDHSASHGQARDHAFIMDRPEAKGGQNKGPMGGEALLLGLGGCFMSNLLAAAKARDIRISDAKTEITAELADAPSRYTDIHVANTLAKAVNLSIECG